MRCGGGPYFPGSLSNGLGRARVRTRVFHSYPSLEITLGVYDFKDLGDTSIFLTNPGEASTIGGSVLVQYPQENITDETVGEPKEGI